MKIIKIFILLLLITNCSDKKAEKQLTEFDKILGKENSVTLTYLVSDFEKDFLKRQYPNLDTKSAYRNFLTELRDGKTDNWRKISEKSRERFKSSDLRLEMYRFPDSVWVLENSEMDKIEEDSLLFLHSPVPYLKSRYKYNNPDGPFEYTYSRTYGDIKLNADFDSIVESEMKKPEFNFIGKYLMAIESVKQNSDFLKEFYDVKNGFGHLIPELTAKVMLEYNVDLNNTLIRKIIVLELAY
jgi:hypothetical protein